MWVGGGGGEGVGGGVLLSEGEGEAWVLGTMMACHPCETRDEGPTVCEHLPRVVGWAGGWGAACTHMHGSHCDSTAYRHAYSLWLEACLPIFILSAPSFTILCNWPQWLMHATQQNHKVIQNLTMTELVGSIALDS